MSKQSNEPDRLDEKLAKTLAKKADLQGKPEAADKLAKLSAREDRLRAKIAQRDSAPPAD